MNIREKLQSIEALGMGGKTLTELLANPKMEPILDKTFVNCGGAYMINPTTTEISFRLD